MTTFYRLTTEEWIQAVRDLNESQKDVLYYIRTLDPFGDREVDIGVREMARILNYNPGTVSRALQALKNKGYIDLEMLHVRVRIKHPKQVLSQNNSVASEQHPRSQNNTCASETTPSIAEQHPRSQNNTCDAEPASSLGSETPQTNKTIQTLQPLKNSLSPDERELIDFVQKKLRNTEGIRDLRAYAIAILERDRDHWQSEFEREQQKADLPPPPRPVEKISAEETPEQRLERYRIQWLIPACKPGIRTAIAAHPQWGITLDQVQEQLPNEHHQHDHRDPRIALSNGSPACRAVPPD